MLHKRGVFLLTVLLAATAALAGCSGTSRESVPADPGHPIKLAGAVRGRAGFSGTWSMKKSFFEKRGVEVELVWFPVYSDSLQALATGQVDANSQTLSDTLAPLSKGIKLKAVLVVAVNSGLGFAIMKAQRFLNTEQIFVGIIVIGLLGLISDRLFAFVNKRLFPWV